MTRHRNPRLESAKDRRTVIQHRVEAGVDKVLAEMVVSRRPVLGFPHESRDEVDDEALTDVFTAFQRNQPRLSDEEVGRIADQIAERLLDLYGGRVRPSKLKAVRRTIRDVALGVIAGLLTPGAAALATYIMHAAGLSAAGAEDESSRRKSDMARQRNMEVQRRLLAGLPMRTIRVFERDSWLVDTLRLQLIKVLRETVQPDLTQDISIKDSEIGPYFGHPVVSAFLGDLWDALGRDLAAHVEASKLP